MRKQLIAIIITLLMASGTTAQDQKITSLTPTNTVSSSDIFYTVINPGTSPASRKITLLNLFASGNGFRSLKDYGPDGTARHVDDAAISNGSTTLTSATASFVAADVGHTVSIKGAGTAGVPLITTIGSITNSTTVVLAAAASATVSAKRCIIGKDNTNQFVTAIAAMSGKTLYVPPGRYVVKMTATSGGAETIASNTTLIGEGANSVIYIIGSDGKATGSADDDQKAAFYIADGSSKITVDGLHFIGENGPYTWVGNNQSNVIWSPGVGGTLTKDVEVRDCIFENLFGFSVHNAGTAERFNVRNCTFSQSANGLNVNSDYSQQTGNHFIDTEGLEASGAFSNYSDNTFYYTSLSASQTVATFSVGGTYLAGAAAGSTDPAGLRPGSSVEGNRIYKAPATAMNVGSGFTRGLIRGNSIYEANDTGIVIANGDYATSDNIVEGNTVVSCGKSGVSFIPFALEISSNASGTQVVNNLLIDEGLSGFEMKYGIISQAASLIIRGNRMACTLKDVSLSGANVLLSGNVFDVAKFEITGGGSILGDQFERVVNTVSFSATPTFDASLGDTQKITLTANVTGSTLSNSQTGQIVKLMIVQGGSGSYTVTWPTNVKWAGGTAPTLSTTVGRVDVFTGVYDGTNLLIYSQAIGVR